VDGKFQVQPKKDEGSSIGQSRME